MDCTVRKVNRKRKTRLVTQHPIMTTYATFVGGDDPDDAPKRTFRTSICGLFRDPRRRTDCWAVAWGGVLMHDRNRHMMGFSPTVSWPRRIVFQIGIPLVGFLVARHAQQCIETLGVVACCRRAFPDDGSGPFLDAFNGSRWDSAYDNATDFVRDFTSPTTLTESEVEELRLWEIVFGVSAHVTVAWVVVVLFLGASSRFRFRKHVMEITNPNSQDTWRKHRKGHRAATTMIGCYSMTPEERGAFQKNRASDDVCNCLFRFLANFCCSLACNCWCQCCGMCAAAQEESEIVSFYRRDSELGHESREKIDFVTFQPLAEFGNEMKEIRSTGDRTWRSHYKAQSKLSLLLWRSWMTCLALLGLYAFLPFFSITMNQFLVVLATFLQAFLILFVVYWWRNRMDISLDTVTKCFASGFLMSTQIAFVSETLVSGLIEVLLGFVIENSVTHWFVSAMRCFTQAFVVAAGSEELSKYFGFWMIETPDSTSKVDSRSLSSCASGITIAMVSTAVGFACCENLEYVFAAGSDVGAELTTLLVRSLFPVHPLVAAIQSIGVCRREIEGDKTFRLGRIILPAVLIHGFFDFFLMIAPLVELIILSSQNNTGRQSTESSHNATEFNTFLVICNGTINSDVWFHADVPPDPSYGQLTGIIVSYSSMVLSALTVVIGVAIYVIQARSQRRRIKQLANDCGERTSLL